MPPDADLLRRVIEASGLSARRFAREVLLRDDRTVRRWLSGESPIPKIVVRYLCTRGTGGDGEAPVADTVSVATATEGTVKL